MDENVFFIDVFFGKNRYEIFSEIDFNSNC